MLEGFDASYVLGGPKGPIPDDQIKHPVDSAPLDDPYNMERGVKGIFTVKPVVY